jgi:anti-anti-sigma regulatory factor
MSCLGRYGRHEPESNVNFKVERTVDGKRVILRLSGRLRAEHLAELKSLIADGGPAVVLDLDDIIQLDVETIHFLRRCRAEGTELRNCSPFICEWMDREQGQEG